MLEAVAHPDHVTDWGLFKEGVQKSFSDLDRIMTARLKIKEIKQGRESVDDYVVRFEEHEGFTGFDDAALVEIFKEGLSAGNLSRCYSLEAIPSMLAAWKEKSRHFYHNYVELQQHSQGPQPPAMPTAMPAPAWLISSGRPEPTSACPYFYHHPCQVGVDRRQTGPDSPRQMLSLWRGRTLGTKLPPERHRSPTWWCTAATPPD
jgi:hypothetical protein